MATISGTVTFTTAELTALAKQIAPLIPQAPPVTPPVIPPVVTPPATGVFWLFNAGKFVGAGDYDFGSGSVNYGQTVMVKGDEGYQPRMPADNFNTKGYNYLLVSIKPTQANNTWSTGAEMIGDVPVPGSNGMISIMKYGPNPAVVGQWNDYKIPLTAMSIPAAGLNIYKIAFLETASSNKNGNLVEFDRIGFAP